MSISVVIPIYNVAPYLCRCLDSIMHQSYTDLEVWLVDDGSQDESGAIADAYAAKDRRMHAIHKENGGLSDARNAGVARATGEYLFFLDSDDWLREDALQNLYDVMVEERADIVVGEHYYAYEDELWIDKELEKRQGGYRYYSKEESMAALVQGKEIKNFAWGKLYKTAIIKEIPFPKGKLFEDIFWQHQVFDRMEKCIVIHTPIVYYYQRKNSIVGTFKPKNLERLEGLYERYKFIEQHYPALVEAMHYQLATACIEYEILLFLHRKQFLIKSQEKAIHHFIKAYYKPFIQSAKGDKALTWSLRFAYIHLYALVAYRVVQKVRRIIKTQAAEVTMVQVQPMKERSL